MRTNADCNGQLLEDVVMLDAPGQALLRQAAEQLALSARGYHRTLADLDGADGVGRLHIAEALAYRGRDNAAGAGGVMAALFEDRQPPAPVVAAGLKALGDGRFWTRQAIRRPSRRRCRSPGEP